MVVDKEGMVSVAELFEVVEKVLSEKYGEGSKVRVIREQSGAVSEIVESFSSIDEVTTVFNEVSMSLKEMSTKTYSESQGLVKDLQQLLEITEQNTAGTEEIAVLIATQDTMVEAVAGYSKKVLELSELLETFIQRFRV